MKKKLLAIVTVAAVISLTLSTYAVVMCARAFSRRIQNITGTAAPVGPAAVPARGCASSADPAPTVRAGIEGEGVYLLICDGGRLFALDEHGNEIFTSDLDPDILGAEERELLSRGLSLSGDAALREAIEDLLR